MERFDPSHGRSRLTSVASAVVAALLVAGCSSQAPSQPASASPIAVATRAPTPSASRTAAPSPGIAHLPDDVPVSQGTFQMAPADPYGVPPVRITFTVPADGWDSWGPGVSKGGGSVVGLGVGTVAYLLADPCHRDRGPVKPPIGPTVDDLARGLAALPGNEVSGPTDVTVDGFAGKHIELTVDPAIDFAKCDAAFFSAGWITPNWDGIPVLSESQVTRYWILDAGGTRLMIFTTHNADTPKSDLAELEELIRSIDLEIVP